MEVKCFNFMMIFPVLLLSFLILKGEEKVIDYTESWHQFALCFFKVFCELDEGHELRRPMSIVSYETSEFIHDQLNKLLPVKVSFTPDDFVSETFLNTTAKYVLCNLTETQRENLENDYGVVAMDYLSEVCRDPLRVEACKNLDLAMAVYVEYFDEKVKNGQCHKVDEMLHTI